MEIKQTAWQAKQTCPHCGQGNPIFCYCNKCGYVTLKCLETGDIFKDPRNLNSGLVERCSNCGQTNMDDFLLADSTRILNAGFKKDDYE